MSKRVVIAGGGAAGFFAAINIKDRHPDYKVQILEKSQTILGKVRISGGGRCNVTHACFDPAELVNRYPRGSRELLAPFKRFNPSHTIEWFKQRGVMLKTEADGRMFPVSDNSETIINCFLHAAEKHRISISTGTGINKMSQTETGWKLYLSNGSSIDADIVIVATGSSRQAWQILETLGHTITEPVPSLFTFNIKDPRLEGIPGIAAADAEVSVSKLKARGPLLVTHWGLSGPGILRLSAWGARALADQQYRFRLSVNFIPGSRTEDILQQLQHNKQVYGRKTIAGHAQYNLPLRLWEKLVSATGIPAQTTWADSSKEVLRKLAMQLCEATFDVDGKSTFKEEFVTAGGISLKEVDFKTMQSRICPGLYLAGEVLDIDAITGGYNFQAAWTEAWIISESV